MPVGTAQPERVEGRAGHRQFARLGAELFKFRRDLADIRRRGDDSVPALDHVGNQRPSEMDQRRRVGAEEQDRLARRHRARGNRALIGRAP